MQKPMKKLFLLLCLVLCSVLQGQAKEITLFNSDGEAVAYINDSDSDLPIYMWDGTPVAYLARAIMTTTTSTASTGCTSDGTSAVSSETTTAMS